MANVFYKTAVSNRIDRSRAPPEDPVTCPWSSPVLSQMFPSVLHLRPVSPTPWGKLTQTAMVSDNVFPSHLQNCPQLYLQLFPVSPQGQLSSHFSRDYPTNPAMTPLSRPAMTPCLRQYHLSPWHFKSLHVLLSYDPRVYSCLPVTAFSRATILAFQFSYSGHASS